MQMHLSMEDAVELSPAVAVGPALDLLADSSLPGLSRQMKWKWEKSKREREMANALKKAIVVGFDLTSHSHVINYMMIFFLRRHAFFFSVVLNYH